jgi:cysteine desulfurase/selenocysteine lyase
LLSIAEHHANIVPWLHLKETIGIDVEFIGLTPDYELDFIDFEKKLTPKVKVISLTAASNVAGSVLQLEKVKELLDEKYGVCHSRESGNLGDPASYPEGHRRVG